MDVLNPNNHANKSRRFERAISTISKTKNPADQIHPDRQRCRIPSQLTLNKELAPL